ncbi:hypothetical protein RhiirA5_433627 [Rhizophagus irregularis]|uniref:Uncharacterized protein n=1 Tax=Rhizophagus irregularis TaxID=588596 RepID=A0A2N0NRH5_9GLOM|nr:hypothetical protein RhiirA5_433627 [Rhizophagus irregularis]
MQKVQKEWSFLSEWQLLKMQEVRKGILLLFEKHKEFGPNILQYIHNSLLYNLPLLECFNEFFTISSQLISMREPINTEKQELKDDVKKFDDLIPEKGTTSLQENLKAMRNDTENSKLKNTTPIKKSNIPKDPILGLTQLQIWAQLDIAKELFSKIFLVNELQWLLWAFGDNMNNKRKKNLIPLILEHLKKGTSFSEEAISKGQIFAV